MKDNTELIPDEEEVRYRFGLQMAKFLGNVKKSPQYRHFDQYVKKRLDKHRVLLSDINIDQRDSDILRGRIAELADVPEEIERLIADSLAEKRKREAAGLEAGEKDEEQEWTS